MFEPIIWTVLFVFLTLAYGAMAAGAHMVDRDTKYQTVFLSGWLMLGGLGYLALSAAILVNLSASMKGM